MQIVIENERRERNQNKISKIDSAGIYIAFFAIILLYYDDFDRFES